MAGLIREPNLVSPDDFYEALLNEHEGLSEEESHAFNARLVLILANQIGDPEILRAALDAAANAPGREG